MTDFGTDVSCFGDLDPSFADLTGPRVVAEAVARRLMTPHGSIDYDPDYGLDVRTLLSAALDESRLFGVRAAIQAEAEKDERVRSALVTIETTGVESIRVRVTLETTEAPVRLTLGIDKVNVELLTAE